MAKVVIADLDKAIKLIETAMKTESKNGKLREQQRKKAEGALEAFLDNYSARTKELVAKKKRHQTDLEKARGVAESELDKDHALTAKLIGLIDIAKKVPYDPHYEELDKAIRALENWDVETEKLDLPKQAIKHVENFKAVDKSDEAAIEKSIEEYAKAATAAKKDLDAVEDADVKKELSKILDEEI
jgi:hypothetical protein